jgi:hypothetical protein
MFGVDKMLAFPVVSRARATAPRVSWPFSWRNSPIVKPLGTRLTLRLAIPARDAADRLTILPELAAGNYCSAPTR